MRSCRRLLQQLDGAVGALGGATSPATSRSSRLLERIAARDTAAFERFYDIYSPTIHGLLLKISGDASDAADLLQETFFQVWQTADRYDGSRGSELAWLVTIARSRAIDRLRSRQTRAIREQESAREIYLDDSRVDKGTAEGDVVLKELSDLVREAMRELPAEQRQVIELAYFQGKTQTQIAAELSTPLGSVKTRVQLAMKKLRNRIAPKLKP